MHMSVASNINAEVTRNIFSTPFPLALTRAIGQFCPKINPVSRGVSGLGAAGKWETS
jgi:hypothetical protein